ncbi:SWI/SNF-related matrix-associated actin-dependent regulator of chromatin subfamily A containing DEAD/H box 1A-like [Osmerus mordax]|uniref:SWI/SNF-related matrix-associated actin-dependent regulator of chromatin subfamily A containing DEAD/H box 1A-like n=1 Tax=Osmerus mordax TaxID=8014 RepID=UPI00350F0953
MFVDDSNSDTEDEADINKPIKQIKEPVKTGVKREKRGVRSPDDGGDKEEEEEEEEVEDRVTRLLDMFPQIPRGELLEVVQSTSTLEGAVALCLMQHGDKEDPDSNRKRKQDGSCSSQDSDVVQPAKKRRPSVEEDSEQEGEEPSFEKQEAMVRKLQRKFQDQDKEELRAVLQEHGWNYDDALEVLRMFSDQEESSFSSPEVREKKPDKRHEPRDTRESRDRVKDHRESNRRDTRESRNSKDGNRDTRESRNGKDSRKENQTSGTSLLSTWLTSAPLSSAPSKKPSSSSSITQKLSKFASATSVAKKEAVERKRKARASDERAASSEDEEEETQSSEFEGSEDELESGSEEEEEGRRKGQGSESSVKSQILRFFREASVDELSLISGCSVKKAQKIVELRPFDSWQSLSEVLQREQGLSQDLLQGCKVVLKERTVVLGLMSRCEGISSKMVRGVTHVMNKEPASLKQPTILNSQLQLKPYQLIGLKWLLLLHQHKLSGILADEMGLGKTIQAIAFLAQLHQDGLHGPHLITVPSSTLDNWVRELKLWCPSLKVLVYYGSVEDRRYLRHDILNDQVEFNVIVSTYNLAIGNDSDRSLFRKLKLEYAVFDEGHMLKNMNSLRYRHLMAINAQHRLLLTGTPMQNNLQELMSLLNFIMPNMFSSSTSQIAKMFSMKPLEEQSRFQRDRITQAKLIMKPFILRRVKSQVLQQLPAKVEKVEFCSMSEKQQQLYQDLLTKLKRTTTGEKRELCNVMMQLRKMANHPLLHRQYYTSEKLHCMSKLMLKEPSHFDADAALIQEDMEVMSDFELHRLCQQYSTLSSYQLDTDTLLDSGKFRLLTQLLASIMEKGDRVVLFSQFTMMLDIVEILLKHLKHRYVRLDGSTPIADRIVLIDEYNTDPEIFVFLLSTRAGGLGINLTSANVVILHDIDCNPYNDKQAEDRCHRVGQTKTVKVIKLISKDSIEDCMLTLGQRKLKLEQDMTAAEEGDEGSIPEDLASLLKASLGL